jgi:glycosyltransferase involved in cell wall biosynthesis
VRFRIIGRGPERDRLQSMIREQRLEECASISDPVPIEQIAEVMANTDLGIVPKRRDSFGNEAFSTKIMEFMAMGVPVVASDTRIDRYYFNDELVHFCESGNAEDFAAKIVELARSPEKRDALRSNASRFIEQNNWEVKKYEYFNLVDHLLGGRRYVHDPQDAQSTSAVL